MNKSDYQLLRWSVECLVADLIHDHAAARLLVNQLMGEFVSAMAASQIKQASGKRAFRTFRRDASTITPSWAYRKPGISSRLPTL